MTVLRVIDILHAIACKTTIFRLSHIFLELDLPQNVVSRYLHVFQVKGLVERVVIEGHGHEWFKTIFNKRVLPTPDTIESAGKTIARILDILQFIQDTHGDPFRNKDLCDAVSIAPPVATRYLQIVKAAGIIQVYGKAQYCIARVEDEAAS